MSVVLPRSSLVLEKAALCLTLRRYSSSAGSSSGGILAVDRSRRSNPGGSAEFGLGSGTGFGSRFRGVGEGISSTEAKKQDMSLGSGCENSNSAKGAFAGITTGTGKELNTSQKVVPSEMEERVPPTKTP